MLIPPLYWVLTLQDRILSETAWTTMWSVDLWTKLFMMRSSLLWTFQKQNSKILLQLLQNVSKTHLSTMLFFPFLWILHQNGKHVLCRHSKNMLNAKVHFLHASQLLSPSTLHSITDMLWAKTYLQQKEQLMNTL